MNAAKDSNFINTLTAVLNTDGKTVIRIKVSPSTHSIKAIDAATGSDNGPLNAEHDENFVPTLMGVSSQTTTVNGVNYVQGVTPVVVYADSSGNLLIDDN